jgi:hypothetical protein
MTPVSASSHHTPAEEAHFRHPITVAQCLHCCVLRSRSSQNHPVGGQRGDKISTVIVGPPPITTARAAQTQDAAPTNPHRRQTT